jgi:alpha-galactosidase
MEALACGQPRSLDAINIPNRGYIPNLPDGAVVEVPARADANGWQPTVMAPLPEPIAAMIRTQLSIHQLLIEAFAEQSKAKLLQAVLLEPTVHSYRAAVAMVDEMLTLQKEVLPPLY